MIDLDAIKAIPDDKPRKGPARMSKSKKDVEVRRRYKDEMRSNRILSRVARRMRRYEHFVLLSDE